MLGGLVGKTPIVIGIRIIVRVDQIEWRIGGIRIVWSSLDQRDVQIRIL